MFHDPGKSSKSPKQLSCFGTVFILNVFCLHMPWPLLICVLCFYVLFTKYVLLSLDTLIFVQSYILIGSAAGWLGLGQVVPGDKGLNLCSAACYLLDLDFYLTSQCLP